MSHHFPAWLFWTWRSSHSLLNCWWLPWGCQKNMLGCKVLVTQSRLTLCNPMGCSPPGSSVHGIFPGKNTGVSLPFPSPGDGVPNLEIEPGSPALQADSLLSEPPENFPVLPMGLVSVIYRTGYTWERFRTLAKVVSFKPPLTTRCLNAFLLQDLACSIQQKPIHARFHELQALLAYDDLSRHHRWQIICFAVT